MRNWVAFIKKIRYQAQVAHWTLLEVLVNTLKEITGTIYIKLSVRSKKLSEKIFLKRWLKKSSDGNYFDFKGAKLPDISQDRVTFNLLRHIFIDTFLVPCFFKDNHSKIIVERVEKYTPAITTYMPEGPYGYTDGRFDVTVKTGDIVIDAGAWIGDFSAYAASKGAEVYAFEPVQTTFAILQETAKLNDGKIYPVQKGLGATEENAPIYISQGNSGANTVMFTGKNSETITLTTLDKFVEENHIERVDFIKADIEGAERLMLLGAKQVLKKFEPKLAICTYHLPDDPEVLEKLIKAANPRYTVRHLKHKLFACCE